MEILNQVHQRAFNKPWAALPGCQILTLKHLGVPIGMCTIYPTGKEHLVAIYDFCIHPDHQHKGYGQQLLLHLFDWCLQHHKTSMFLSISETDPSADRLTRFYTSTFLSTKIGNFIYMGRVVPSYSFFYWTWGKYLSPIESVRERKVSLYLDLYISPSKWISCVTQSLPYYEKP